jgi:hypothetical protein
MDRGNQRKASIRIVCSMHCNHKAMYRTQKLHTVRTTEIPLVTNVTSAHNYNKSNKKAKRHYNNGHISYFITDHNFIFDKTVRYYNFKALPFNV